MIRIWFTLSTLPVQALSASLTSPPTTSPPSLHTVSAYLQLLTETLPSPVSGYLSVLFPLPGSLFLLLFVGLSPSHSEKAMATHSSTLAWKIPWPEEPGRLQSMESRRAGHNWATSLSLFTCIGEGNGNPLQCSCLENPRDSEPGGLPSMWSHRVGHDWSNLAAAAAAPSHYWCSKTTFSERLFMTTPVTSVPTPHALSVEPLTI